MWDYTAVGTKLIVTPHLQFPQLHLVLVTTLTPTSSAGPTKLIDSYPTLAVHTGESGCSVLGNPVAFSLQRGMGLFPTANCALVSACHIEHGRLTNAKLLTTI